MLMTPIAINTSPIELIAIAAKAIFLVVLSVDDSLTLIPKIRTKGSKTMDNQMRPNIETIRDSIDSLLFNFSFFSLSSFLDKNVSIYWDGVVAVRCDKKFFT